MHRPWTIRSTDCFCYETGAERTPGSCHCFGRHARFGIEPNRRSKEPGLINGLGCPDLPQLRRPVGGADNERNGREVGLDDRSVKVGCRGAARAGHHRRCATSERVAKSGEGSCSLVMKDRDLDPLVGGKGKGKWR